MKTTTSDAIDFHRLVLCRSSKYTSYMLQKHSNLHNKHLETAMTHFSWLQNYDDLLSAIASWSFFPAGYLSFVLRCLWKPSLLAQPHFMYPLRTTIPSHQSSLHLDDRHSCKMNFQVISSSSWWNASNSEQKAAAVNKGLMYIGSSGRRTGQCQWYSISCIGSFYRTCVNVCVRDKNFIHRSE